MLNADEGPVNKRRVQESRNRRLKVSVTSCLLNLPSESYVNIGADLGVMRRAGFIYESNDGGTAEAKSFRPDISGRLGFFIWIQQEIPKA